MGKSVAARMFARLGVPVFDADAEVHRLQGPGGVLLGPIEARFPGTTGHAGVDRAALGGRVIGKAEELKALEAIVHPAVRASRQAFLRRHGGHAMLLFDIPLLFETGGEVEMDLVVVVSAPLFLLRPAARQSDAGPCQTGARGRHHRHGPSKMADICRNRAPGDLPSPVAGPIISP